MIGVTQRRDMPPGGDRFSGPRLCFRARVRPGPTVNDR